MPVVRGLPTQSGIAVRGGVKVLGIPQLLAKLGAVSSTARLGLGAVVAGGGIHMFNLAQEYVPVVTGNLKSSIKLEKGVGPYTYEISAASTEGNNPEKNGKEYAGFVENGTSKMEGRFFMRRAFQETHPLVISELAAVAAALQRL